MFNHILVFSLTRIEQYLLISTSVLISCASVLSAVTLQYLLNVALGNVSASQVHLVQHWFAPQ